MELVNQGELEIDLGLEVSKLINLIRKLPPYRTLNLLSSVCILSSGFLQEDEDPLLDIYLETLQALFLEYGNECCEGGLLQSL